MGNWRVLLKHKEYESCYKVFLYIDSNKFQIGKDYKYRDKEDQEKIWREGLDFATKFENSLMSTIIYADN